MRLFTVLLFALALITTHAHANTATAPSRSVLDKVADALKNPSKARKIFNPTGIAAQLAFDKLLEGIDYVMNEGPEAQQKDKEANKREYYSNAQSSYPYEYFVDGKVFSSPEAIHAYIVSDAYLAKKGYKRTRRGDGLYYDKMTVDYSGMAIAHVVQVGDKNFNYANNVGGGIQTFYSSIYLVGTLSDKEVERNDEQAEKERKRKIIERLARQYEADLAEAEANNPPSDKEKEQDETKDKPKTGTGAGTADNTATNTKDETEATTQSGTGTKKDEKDKDNQKDKELPTFCNWAGVVCDFIDWMKEPPPSDEPPKQVPKATIGDMGDLQSVDRFKQRINFDGQCPTGNLSFQVKAVSYSYQIPYHHFCRLLEQLRPWLLAFTYLSTAFFVVRSI